jgi:hypothetical protein
MENKIKMIATLKGVELKSKITDNGDPRVIGKVKIGDQEKDLVSLQRNGEYANEVDGINFAGHRVLWAFEYKPKNYLKESELSGDEWRKGGSMTIFRNGVSVFKEFCRTPERAFVVMQYILPKLQDFHYWDELKKGKKLYNHDVPVVITDICADGEIMVKTEDGKPIPWAFKIEELKNDPENYEDEWGDSDRVHILSEHLSWHRK